MMRRLAVIVAAPLRLSNITLVLGSSTILIPRFLIESVLVLLIILVMGCRVLDHRLGLAGGALVVQYFLQALDEPAVD